jgi:hypothetical protein
MSMICSFLLAKTDRSTLDIYQTGYENALVDIQDFFDEFSDSEQLLTSVTQFLKEKEIDMKALTGNMNSTETHRLEFLFVIRFRHTR